MKKFNFTLILFVAFQWVNAQITIGDNVGTATDKTSVLLEFKNNDARGLILPSVTKLPQIPTQGTLLLDATTKDNALIKLFSGNKWEVYSPSGDASKVIDNRLGAATNDNTDSKMIVGNAKSLADGVLVLESTTKAMVLPTVTDINSIVNPSPGMMVYYIKSSTEKYLSFYNGTNWAFWTYTPTN